MAIIPSQITPKSPYLSQHLRVNQGKGLIFKLGLIDSRRIISRANFAKVSTYSQLRSKLKSFSTRGSYYSNLRNNLLARYLRGSVYKNLLSILQDYFGENVRQDGEKIYIRKSDLNIDSYRGESILAALLLKASSKPWLFLPKVSTDLWKIEFIKVNGVSVVRHIYTIKLFVPVAYDPLQADNNENIPTNLNNDIQLSDLN